MSRRLAIIEGQRLALALGAPDPSQVQRLRALEAETVALRRQLADRAAQQPDPLAEHNEELHAAGERLRATIAALLEANPGPKRGAAKRILRPLLETKVGREQQPSVRCVQWHITALRKAGRCTDDATPWIPTRGTL